MGLVQIYRIWVNKGGCCQCGRLLARGTAFEAMGHSAILRSGREISYGVGLDGLIKTARESPLSGFLGHLDFAPCPMSLPGKLGR